MDLSDIKVKLLAIFSKNTNQILPNTEENYAFDYLKGGFVSSIQMVLIIAEIEDFFGISFTSEELGSVDFRSVSGIASIVEEKLKAMV